MDKKDFTKPEMEIIDLGGGRYYHYLRRQYN